MLYRNLNINFFSKICRRLLHYAVRKCERKFFVKKSKFMLSKSYLHISLNNLKIDSASGWIRTSDVLSRMADYSSRFLLKSLLQNRT